MTLGTAISVNGVKIRLTDERWRHIFLTHPEIKDDDYHQIMKVISNPDFILKGSKGEHLAVKKITGKKNWIVVPYKEIDQEDGFVITAYFSNDLSWLLKKEIVWNKE